MTRFVVRHIAPEMAALGLLELLLTFALAYIMVSPGDGMVDASAVRRAALLALTVGFIAFVVGLYRPQMFTRARSLVFNTAVSAILSFPAVWVVSKLSGLSGYWPVGYDTLRPVKIVLLWCAAVVAIRFIFLFAARWNLFVHRVAVVGDALSGNIQAALAANRPGFLEVAAIAPERVSAARLSSTRVRTLVVGDQDQLGQLAGQAGEFRRRGVAVRTEEEFWEHHLRRIDVASLDEGWFAALAPAQAGLGAVVGRLFDIVTSLALLITTVPVMVAVCVLIVLDSPGPVLYRQQRVGLGGHPFTVLKFRSMRMNAEASGPAWAQQRDPRVTRIGAFMRRTRIDELPQLINILRGEMSFIGPRPERPHFVEQLAAAIPFYAERLRVKPGLTGWAQVNYPYGASVEDARAKLSYDLYYVKHKTIVFDILILLSTVRVILFQEGSR